MLLSLSSNDERIVAVLHDVCEDCPGWTLHRLHSEGFSDEIIEALDSVTKRNGEDYESFVRRAAANPIGRRVKLADLHDNCNLSRIAAPSAADFKRIEKYRHAIDLIHAFWRSRNDRVASFSEQEQRSLAAQTVNSSSRRRALRRRGVDQLQVVIFGTLRNSSPRLRSHRHHSRSVRGATASCRATCRSKRRFLSWMTNLSWLVTSWSARSRSRS
jgi:hypothetical protein